MTDEKEPSAFYKILAELEKQEPSGEKGFRFLTHPSKLIKYALNTKSQVSIIEAVKRNDAWLSSKKDFDTRGERTKLLNHLDKENVFSDMENHNKSVKEINKAKKEGQIKTEEYSLF